MKNELTLKSCDHGSSTWRIDLNMDKWNEKCVVSASCTLTVCFPSIASIHWRRSSSERAWNVITSGRSSAIKSKQNLKRRVKWSQRCECPSSYLLSILSDERRRHSFNLNETDNPSAPFMSCKKELAFKEIATLRAAYNARSMFDFLLNDQHIENQSTSDLQHFWSILISWCVILQPMWKLLLSLTLHELFILILIVIHTWRIITTREFNK